MGSLNCCKKPFIICGQDLKKSSAIDNDIDNQNLEDNPQDTQLNVNGKEDNGEIQTTSNQIFNDKEGIPSNKGVKYESPNNGSYHQQNNEEEKNEDYNIQTQKDEESQYVKQNNVNEGKQEGEGPQYYNTEYPIQMADGKNSNILRMGNNSQQVNINNNNLCNPKVNNNVGGVDLKSLEQNQSNIKSLSLEQQQKMSNTKQMTNKSEYYSMDTNGKQVIIENQVNISNQNDIEDFNRLFKPATSQYFSVNSNQNGIISQGDIDNNNFWQQNSPPNNIQTNNEGTVTQHLGDDNKLEQRSHTQEIKKEIKMTRKAPTISEEEDAMKYYKKVIDDEVKSVNYKGIGNVDLNISKSVSKNDDLKNLSESAGTSVNNNLKQIKSETKAQVINALDMKDLPEVFGSSDINNYKQITTTTTTQIIGNQDIKNLPEVFGSSDINHFKQTETTGQIDLKDKPEHIKPMVDSNNFNQIITTSTKEGIVDSKAPPEVFRSSGIKKFKQTVTTIIKNKKNDKKDLHLSPTNNNDFKQTTTTIAKEGIIDMKDLPEVFGSSDINNFKQTTTTTTIIKEGNIDMKDLPEVFGSSDINNIKQITTTTTTKEVGNNDLFGIKPSPENNNVEQTTTTITKNIESVPIDLKKGIEQKLSTNPINGNRNEDYHNNFKQSVSHAISEPLYLKQFGQEQNSSVLLNNYGNFHYSNKETNKGHINSINLKEFGIEKNLPTNQINENENYNKYLNQFESKNTSEPIDLYKFGLEPNSSAVKQITTTTTTKIIENAPANINSNDNGHFYDIHNMNNLNVNQTTTTTKISQNPAFDSKQFEINQNQNDSSYGTVHLNELNQHVSGTLDLNQLGKEGQSNISSGDFQEATITSSKNIQNGSLNLNQFENVNSLPPNNGEYNFNNTSGSKKTGTNLSKSTYVAPSQSHHLNYNFN